MKKQLILADLHTHLNEKKLDPKDWWAAVKKRKLSVVAITEHSFYEPHDAYLQLKATQPKGIILIPGVEAKTSVGDLLIYGEDESIYHTEDIFIKGINVDKALIAVKKHNLVASFAHPHGFNQDAICYRLGEKKALAIVKKYKTGAEYYDGMLGSANQLVFGRKAVKKFFGFLEFMDKNKATTKLRINWPTHKAKNKLEKVAGETLERVRKGMIFSQKAEFITVGSDAHYPRAIGSAVLSLKRKPKNQKDFLNMLKNKEILWAGPNIYSKEPINKVGRKEIWEGIVYATKKKLLKKPKIRFVKKIRHKIALGKGIKTIKRITKVASKHKNLEKKPKKK